MQLEPDRVIGVDEWAGNPLHPSGVDVGHGRAQPSRVLIEPGHDLGQLSGGRLDSHVDFLKSVENCSTVGGHGVVWGQCLAAIMWRDRRGDVQRLPGGACVQQRGVE